MLRPLYVRRSEGEPADEAVVIRLADNYLLGLAKAQVLGGYLWSLAEQAGCRVVLSCAPVVAVDSIILAEIVKLHKRLSARGGRLVLCRLSTQLYDMLSFLQLTDILTVCDDEKEALRILATRAARPTPAASEVA